MFAIIDKRASQEIKDNLKRYVKEVFEFSSEGLTYNSISGHPDVFMFQDKETLIVAPNTPVDLIAFLQDHKICFEFGNSFVGTGLLTSSRYNCLALKEHYFLRKGYTDSHILAHCKDKKPVFLPQSYVRCSLFNINNHCFISSDQGIVKCLKKTEFDVCYFEPSQISIVDHAYGFLGGTVGKLGDTLFFMGDILSHIDGVLLADFISKNTMKYVCLGRENLYDGGGLFFVDSLY